MIEKVILEVTLKAGKNIWEKGTVLTAPFPPDIEIEVRGETGTVKVVKGNLMPQTKLVFVAERVKETASSMTTMAVKPEAKPSPIREIKPKPKLKRRRR